MVNISPLTSSRFDSFETQVGGAKTFWMNLLCTWTVCSKTIWSTLCVCYEFWPFTVWTHYCLELACSIEVGLILCVIYCIRETLRDLEWQERGGSWSERRHTCTVNTGLLPPALSFSEWLIVLTKDCDEELNLHSPGIFPAGNWDSICSAETRTMN